VLPTNAATNSDSAQECRRGSIIPALAAADCDGVLSVFLVQFADIHEPDTAPCGAQALMDIFARHDRRRR
jgi:hypothetical protein